MTTNFQSGSFYQGKINNDPIFGKVSKRTPKFIFFEIYRATNLAEYQECQKNQEVTEVLRLKVKNTDTNMEFVDSAYLSYSVCRIKSSDEVIITKSQQPKKTKKEALKSRNLAKRIKKLAQSRKNRVKFYCVSVLPSTPFPSIVRKSLKSSKINFNSIPDSLILDDATIAGQVIDNIIEKLAGYAVEVVPKLDKISKKFVIMQSDLTGYKEPFDGTVMDCGQSVLVHFPVANKAVYVSHFICLSDAGHSKFISDNLAKMGIDSSESFIESSFCILLQAWYYQLILDNKFASKELKTQAKTSLDSFILSHDIGSKQIAFR